MSMEPIYKCDPDKNIECLKTYCKHNPDAEYKFCEYTTDIEYSIDGKERVGPAYD